MTWILTKAINDANASIDFAKAVQLNAAINNAYSMELTLKDRLTLDEFSKTIEHRNPTKTRLYSSKKAELLKDAYEARVHEVLRQIPYAVEIMAEIIDSYVNINKAYLEVAKIEIRGD